MLGLQNISGDLDEEEIHTNLYCSIVVDYLRMGKGVFVIFIIIRFLEI